MISSHAACSTWFSPAGAAAELSGATFTANARRTVAEQSSSGITGDVAVPGRGRSAASPSSPVRRRRFGAPSPPLAIDVAQPELIQFVVDRFECRVQAFVAFVVGRKANTDQFAGRVEQTAAAAAFDRVHRCFDVRRTLVAIELVTRVLSAVGSLPWSQPTLVTRSPRSMTVCVGRDRRDRTGTFGRMLTGRCRGRGCSRRLAPATCPTTRTPCGRRFEHFDRDGPLPFESRNKWPQVITSASPLRGVDDRAGAVRMAGRIVDAEPNARGNESIAPLDNQCRRRRRRSSRGVSAADMRARFTPSHSTDRWPSNSRRPA